MKRLLKSSKYWLALHGTVAAFAAYLLTKDITFAGIVAGFWGLGATGNIIEDGIDKWKNPKVNEYSNTNP